MHKSAIFAFGTIMFAASALAADTATDWRTYDYPDFAFSIDFPGQPARTDKTTNENGSIRTAVIDMKNGSEAFSVTTADFTHRNGGPPRDAQTAAHEGMEGVFSIGTMHGLRKFLVPGGSGLEGISITDRETMRVRLYYIAPYTWVIFGSGTNRQDFAALYRGDFKRYFDSFHPHLK